MSEELSSLASRLLQNGCVVLYHNPFLMEAHSNQLFSDGWKFIDVYAPEDGGLDEFYDLVASQLEFPAYFGRNLDAFSDCLSEIEFPASGRLALGLIRFDRLVATDRRFAQHVLDIFAASERRWLMEGKRILFMIQSSDPDLHFVPTGAQPVMWNFEEWLDSKRKRGSSGQ